MKAYIVRFHGKMMAVCTSLKKAIEMGELAFRGEYTNEDNFFVECIEMDKQIED